METLYILVPISVVLVFVIGLLFWWSLRSGQFDDMEGPAYRMLMDDDHPESEGRENPDDLEYAPEDQMAVKTGIDHKK